MIKVKRYMAIILLIISGMLILSSSLFSQVPLIKPVVTIKGKITDKISGKALGLQIDVFDENGRKINITKSNEKDGSYFITGLKPASDYVLKFKTEEMSIQKTKISTPDIFVYEEFIMDFSVDQTANGIETIVIK